MAEHGTFRIPKLKFTFGGVEFTGFTDTDFLTVDYNNDWWTHKSGAGGTTASVQTDRLDATVTLKLLQTSRGNDALSAFMLSDFAANVELPLLIEDLSGTSRYFAATARCSKPATVTFSSEPTDREWVIYCDRLDFFTGGNS